MKKWGSKLWVLLPVFLLAGAGFMAYRIVNPPQAAAQMVVCDGERASDFSCWQERYNAMVAEQDPEAAFVDVKQAYETNPYVKTNCHQIGHVIGRAATQKYPSLEETYKHGDNFCWSGYYHGAIEMVAQEIGSEKILEQVTTVCADFKADEPYSFSHYNCVHGMGHGLMAVKEDDLFAGLKACDKYTDSWERESCYGGVFMENVMNEINGGRTAHLKDDEPLYPCTAVENQYKQQCYLMQTSHALKVVEYDYSKVFELCGGIETEYRSTCYQSLGRDVSGQSSSDQARTIELCMLGQDAAARQNCFTGAVKDFISYHHSDVQGLALCEAIQDAELSESCKSVAKDYYRTF